MTPIEEMTTEQIVEELTNRCPTYAMILEYPGDNTGTGDVVMHFDRGCIYRAMGLARRLYLDIEHESMYGPDDMALVPA